MVYLVLKIWAATYFILRRVDVIKRVLMSFCYVSNSFIILMEQFTAANFESLLFSISKGYFHFFCEFILKHKNVIYCFGKNIDLPGWIINPSEFKRIIDVMTFSTHSSFSSPTFTRSSIKIDIISASNLKVSMGRFIYFLNFFGHNMGLLEVLNTSETWCNLGV